MTTLPRACAGRVYTGRQARWSTPIILPTMKNGVGPSRRGHSISEHVAERNCEVGYTGKARKTRSRCRDSSGSMEVDAPHDSTETLSAIRAGSNPAVLRFMSVKQRTQRTTMPEDLATEDGPKSLIKEATLQEQISSLRITVRSLMSRLERLEQHEHGKDGSRCASWTSLRHRHSPERQVRVGRASPKRTHD